MDTLEYLKSTASNYVPTKDGDTWTFTPSLRPNGVYMFTLPEELEQLRHWLRFQFQLSQAKIDELFPLVVPRTE